MGVVGTIGVGEGTWDGGGGSTGVGECGMKMNEKGMGVEGSTGVDEGTWGWRVALEWVRVHWGGG